LLKIFEVNSAMSKINFVTGLAETISFNISSIVPPSPIAAALFQDQPQEGAQPKHGGSSSKRSRSEENSTQININFDE